MPVVKKVWTHKKYPKKFFNGSYAYAATKAKTSERSFVLIEVTAKKNPKQISFESHEAAKKGGWVKA